MFLAAQLNAYMATADRDSRASSATQSPQAGTVVSERWARVRSQNFTPYSAEQHAERHAERHGANGRTTEAPRVRSRWV